MNVLFKEALDAIRGRIVRLKGPRGYPTVAEKMGLSRQTLMAFMYGETLSQGTIEKIEQWCDREEEQRG